MFYIQNLKTDLSHDWFNAAIDLWLTISNIVRNTGDPVSRRAIIARELPSLLVNILPDHIRDSATSTRHVMTSYSPTLGENPRLSGGFRVFCLFAS